MDLSENVLVSFLIFTYNQEKFIAETITGAFAQTYSPLEIIVSDDRSTDGTYDIIQQMVAEYNGPHKIIVNQNETNMGVGNHLNVVFKLAKGELFIMGAGDDISLPERTMTIFNEWFSSGKLYKSIFSNVILIDEAGNERGAYFKDIPVYTKNIQGFLTISNNWLSLRRQPKCWVLGCSNAIHRSIFDIYGPLDPRIIQEDGAISFRSILAGEIKYLDQSLLKYRRHDSNVFQPKLTKSYLHLKKSEYYYKKSWLKDALMTDSDNKKLIRQLKFIVFKSFIWHKIYNNKMLGMPMVSILFTVKSVAKKTFNIFFKNHTESDLI